MANRGATRSNYRFHCGYVSPVSPRVNAIVGFAKLTVGYLLDEIKNDITRETPASFEPSIDYVVTKIPRFAFEKFPQADPTLTTQMNVERTRLAAASGVAPDAHSVKQCFRRGSRNRRRDARAPHCSLETR